MRTIETTVQGTLVVAEKTRVLLRADGDSATGLGHLHRLLSLAQILQPEFTCVFLTRNAPASIREQIRSVCSLVEVSASESTLEANVFKNMLTANDLVVLDGYSFSTSYQQTIKSAGCRLICIDDIHAYHFVADVILNPAGGVSEKMYSKDLHTQLKTGPAVAFLKKEFREASQWRSEQRKNHSLFLCMGGADPGNHTLSILQRFAQYSFDSIKVVIGEAYQYRESLLAFVQKANVQVEIFSNLLPAELVAAMKQCATAICSASGISYEYLSVGGVLYVEKTAENQSELYKFLTDEGLAFPVNSYPAGEETIKRSLERQAEIFDGHSDKRLLRIFYEQDFHLNVSVRRAVAEDLMIVLEWANDPETRRQSYRPDPISLENHSVWFNRKLNDPTCHLYIFEYKKVPVGMVRFDVGKDAIISYSLSREFRGRGWGMYMLMQAMDELAKVLPLPIAIVGYVKMENESSAITFEKLGFTCTPTDQYPESYKYELIKKL